MKSYGKGRKPGRYKRCLIVDGYNIIPKMQQVSLSRVDDLQLARSALVERLAEYRAFAGEDIILVFDAHHTDSKGAHSNESGIEIYFTLKNETADERIERLVYEYRDIYGQITVATSDYVEQQAIFGGGALRISADELLVRLKNTQSTIRGTIHGTSRSQSSKIRDKIRRDVANILEEWRRQ